MSLRRLELKTDATLAAPGAMPPATRCYWVVTGRLLAGAYPGYPQPVAHEKRITSLWGAGIRTFVSLMEERETDSAGHPFAPYAEDVETLAMRSGDVATCVRFGIRDVSIPSRATMRSVLDCIDRSLADERAVYVHCFGGIGRTGTVIGCWLLRHGLASRASVSEVLTRLRVMDTERASRRSPETAEQLAFVLDWKD